MELRVLGRVDLVGAMLGPKERALVCRLLIGFGSVVHDDELINAVWEGEGPRTARRTLQGNVLRLRKVLASVAGPDGQAIGVVSRAGGYQLTTTGVDLVDVLRFEALLGVARTAIACRDHDTVVSTLRTALELWRGVPFGEFADREWALVERRRLEELSVTARGDLIDAELVRGRHHVVVAELEPMVAAEPFRERSWEQLALALYRCGRQADALRAIQRARTVLSGEIGVEPGSALKALERAILVQDASLDLAAVRADGRGAGTRRTASFLFTDVVEAGIGDDHDALASRLALDRQEGLLRGAIGAVGGEVFRSVGDALEAVFTTASAAIVGATAAARAVANAESGPVSVRMAVSSGEAESVNGGWVGRPLDQCRRLLGTARGGQILVTHTTARLAELELPADLHLVGVGEDQSGDQADGEVFQVVALGLAGGFGASTGAAPPVSRSDVRAERRGIALPSSLARHVCQMWVGRDDEMGILRAAWREATCGAYRTVLIAGEPGAGKTALAARFAAEAARSGARVLHGHCDEDAFAPYGAFAEALEQLVASAAGSMIAEHISTSGGDLCALVPLLARQVPGLRLPVATTPLADRSRIAAAVSGLLQVAADHQPTVIVFDDLHWADSGTAGLLRDLVHRSPRAPLLVVATYRNTDVDPQQPSAQLLADLRRAAGVTRVALPGFSEPDVTELVSVMTGWSADHGAAAFGASLHRDTAGNPFFVIEVLRDLIETAALPMEGEGGSLDVSTVHLPEGIREVVGRRLDRLGADTTDTLRAAAVIGPMFDVDVLDHVCGTGQENVVRVLEAACAAELVAEVTGAVDKWQFTHELVRRTLIGQLSVSRRARLHRNVAEVLERLRPRELAALAHHFAAAAGLGDSARTLSYALAAADQAAAGGAHGDAARFIARAMDAVDDLDEVRQIELLTRIGSELIKAGDAEAGQQSLDRAAVLARNIGSADLLAEAVLTRFSLAWDYAADIDELLAEAFAAGPSSETTRARLLAARARSAAWTGAPAARKRAHVAEAIAAARAVGDPETIGAALVASAFVGAGPDDMAARRAVVDELLAAARAAHRPDWESIGLVHSADHHLTGGNYAAALVDEAELERVTITSRDPFAAVVLGQIASRRACINGDFDRAERLAAEQIPLSQRIGMDRYAAKFTVASLSGQVLKLRVSSADTSGLTRLIPDEGDFTQLKALLTINDSLSRGDLVEAAAVAHAISSIELGHLWGYCVTEATTAIVRSNDAVGAEVLLAQIQPYAHLDCVLDWQQYRGAVAHHIGRLMNLREDYEPAVEHLITARRRYEQLASPPWLVVNGRDLVQALQGRNQRGDRERAASLHRTTTDQALRLGMTTDRSDQHADSKVR